MRNICIIPARGGSKRIPRKNIKEFLGKPIIAYSIELAINSGLFDEIMVSTDDDEIAEIAKKHGAKIPFLRSEKNANDFATTMDVLSEVIFKYKSIGIEFDAVCCIYPTAVLSMVEHLNEGFNLLENNIVVLPVTQYSFPPMRSMKVSNNGYAEFRFPENKNIRSQDLEHWYHDAGQWYWFKSNFFEESELELKQKVIILPNTQVQDIDNDDDWKLAELKYKLINNYV